MVLYVVYLLCSNYVVKKGHEQVEKLALEMKKWSRNGKVIKQGIYRNVYMMFSQCSTCSMHGYIYTLRYNIKGSVATSRAMPTPFVFLGFLKHYVD